MLKQQARLFSRIAMTVDFAMITTAFFSAYHVAGHYTHLLSLAHYHWLLACIIPLWLILLARFNLYASLRTSGLWDVLTDIFKVHLLGAIAASSLIFMLEPRGFSRLFFAIFILFSFFLIFLGKLIIKLFLANARRRGYNIRHVLLVGSGEQLQYYIDTIRKHADWGLVILGVVNFCGDNVEEIPGCINMGDVNELVEICKKNPIDEVVFSLPREKLPAVDKHIAALQEMGITVRMIINIFEVRTSRKELSLFHGDIPLLTFYSKVFDFNQLFLKRCLDILGALVGLTITGLLLPFIALAIRIESKGPLFFGQKRIGENGRLFRCWKFRSMYVDAEERKKELMALNEMNGAMFKIKDDPRITKVGRFIRKTSLDELPQFWNVMRGEMSLVGTRPPTPDEVESYENWHHKRICIKPGITGLWQVSGRSRIRDFDEVARLDIRYIEEWSLWLDIKILLKTIWVVVASRGAR